MPVYKLHYFNLRGRAELARLIMSQAGVEFEDVRFERTEWPALKATMPFGQVPVLEVDGQMLAQSNTISRYLARKHGLAGKDEWEQGLADMYADNIGDLMTGMRPAFLEKDAEKQKELYEKFMTETIATHVAIVEKQLEKNGTGHLVGKELTWADLAYYGFFSFLVEKFGEDFLKDASHLKSLIALVEELPNIKKWVESRPKTEI
ncbi:glutathione S-transferase 1-like [Daphnia carinata]|uniref:glutathione S-transferase 1-like n=1 Tax=Daphnia carinata TaxID=120202 RepID=UPI00257D0E5C|nr:glutathione S-transferase 1-like [Daphnia carinata]XP_057368615.1 glutathione S-transferase 1-like [Daphnia carinata]